MLLPSCTSIRCTYCYLTTNMNGPSNKSMLLSVILSQLFTLLGIFFLMDNQNAFFLEIISKQNAQIQELSETLTQLRFQQGEEKLISEMPVQQKILAKSVIILVVIAFGFFLFFYPPGVASEVVQIITPEVVEAAPSVSDKVFDKALWKKQAKLFLR